MTSLEGFTLFTSGIRFSVLIMLLLALWRSITSTTNQDNIYNRIAHNPKLLFGLISILLMTSLVQVSIEIYDHIVVAP